MKDKILCVAGLARDCEYNLKRNLAIIDNFRPYFKEVKVFILENDSVDGTVNVLHDYSTRHENVFIESFKEKDFLKMTSTGNLDKKIGRLTSYRNRLLERILSSGYSDYIMLVDWDINGIKPELVIKSIENAPADWGALLANGQTMYHLKGDYEKKFLSNKYYDSFSVLFTEDTLDSLKPGFFYSTINRHRISERVSSATKNNDYFEVKSSFGGLGVYKSEAVKDCRYSLLKVGGDYVCEHISFNSAIIEKGYKNYVASEMKTFVEEYHASKLMFYLHKYFPKLRYYLVLMYLTIR